MNWTVLLWAGLILWGPISPNTVSDNDAECDIYVPDAFSPNGDARNDEFAIYPGTTCTFSDFQVRIYDRWGGLHFKSEQSDFTWDGRSGSEDLPQAVYYYVISYSLEAAPGENSQKTIQGYINLLRP
jgi:gliding motility-associated-like protein